MTLYQLWETVNYIAGKFPNGGAITPARLNTILPQVSAEYFADCYRRRDWDALRSFRKTVGEGSVPLVITDGTTTLPSDYYRGGDGYYSRGDENVRIEFVDDETWNNRLSHKIEIPAANYPIAKIQDGSIHFRPKNINYVKFSYLSKPVDPFMDYCVDSTNPSRIIYMPDGSTVEAGVLKQGTTVLESAVLTKTGSLGTYESATVEIDWAEHTHHHIVYLVLQKAGINLSEQLVTQYAMEKEGKG